MFLVAELSDELTERLRGVTLAVFDVDGVLTSGRLQFLADGTEVKEFNILDGLGIKLLQKAGVETAIITGRRSPQVELRAKALGITHLRQGREDKLVALEELWAETGHGAGTTAYIGDDWPDLAAIRAVAFGATVPNGHPLVREHADWCTRRAGGNGAGREFCEQILLARGQLESIAAEYL
ncbi:KdsC family phosphatase [Marinobacterium aestuariivivens]|uniref:3-deoxy-D-manno-octulosonate 8-phosphate phosphatase KdsC n=1 Tax=Marinobacterium aestuariivivens TaxID=1698799 RepID=A0ABW1ZWC3_9GAMM